MHYFAKWEWKLEESIQSRYDILVRFDKLCRFQKFLLEIF